MCGQGRWVQLRLLHVFEFRDGLISRENPWTDTATPAQQLADFCDISYFAN